MCWRITEVFLLRYFLKLYKCYQFFLFQPISYKVFFCAVFFCCSINTIYDFQYRFIWTFAILCRFKLKNPTKNNVERNHQIGFFTFLWITFFSLYFSVLFHEWQWFLKCAAGSKDFLVLKGWNWMIYYSKILSKDKQSLENQYKPASFFIKFKITKSVHRILANFFNRRPTVLSNVSFFVLAFEREKETYITIKWKYPRKKSV